MQTRTPIKISAVGAPATAASHSDDAGKMTWSADGVPEHDRFEVFRETICRQFLSFSPQHPTRKNFSARLQQTRFSKGCISRIDVTPHLAVRTRADVARIPFDYIALNTHLLGRNEIDIGGNKFCHTGHDISIVEGTRINSIALEAPNNYKSMSFIFDKSHLQQSMNIKVPTYGLVPDNLRWQAVRTCLDLASKLYETGSAKSLEQIYEAVRSLLCAALIDDRDYLQHTLDLDPISRGGFAGMIKMIIASRLQDPDLSTFSIATELKVSPRYVQKVFTEEGVTIKAYINSERLQNVRAELADADRDGDSIRSIAFRWGFRDMTTFYRNFKSHFDDTPNQCRLAP